jgi:hypothetical protein
MVNNEVKDQQQVERCDCPACLPLCQRTGRKCFIVCERCRGEVERDEIGPIRSVTRRVNEPSSSPRRR